MTLVLLPTPHVVAVSHPNGHYRIGEAANPGPINLACLDDPDEDPFRYLRHDDNDIIMMTDADHAAHEAVDKLFEPRTIRIADFLDASVPHSVPSTESYGPPNATYRQRRAKDKIDVETCNSTGWSALLHRLQYSQAQVILSQEHHVREDLIKEKSDQAFGLGWKSLWSPTICTADNDDNRFTSGGVAIFVCKYFGLVEFEDNGMKRDSLEPGRLVVGKFSAPGLGSLAIYSAYCLCGVGLNHTNKDLIGKIHEFNAVHGLPWMCGADWNMQPNDLAESGLLGVMKAKIIAPEDPTCIAPTSLRTLDFFMVDELIYDGFEHPTVIDDSVTRPHRPTQTSIKADLKEAKVMKFRTNQKLPTEAVVGPRRKPQCFDLPRELAKLAKEAFDRNDVTRGAELYADAFHCWAVAAEVEVAEASDIVTPRKSSRATKPERINLPLVPDCARGHGEPSKVVLLNKVLQNAQQVTALLSDAMKKSGDAWSKVSRFIAKARSCSCPVDQGSEDYDVQELTHLQSTWTDLLNRTADFARSRLYENNADASDPIWATFANLNCTAAVIRKGLTKAINSIKRATQDSKNKAWLNWREKELNSHAAGAHRFSKPSRGWSPPDVRGVDGKLIANSEGILKQEEGRHSKLWKSSPVGPALNYNHFEPCRRPAPEQLRKTSRTFKKKTWVAPDGWHPRHYALVSDDALEMVADFFELMEMTSLLPAQQRQVYVYLLDKSSGGTRPIGLFTALYRLWSKTRQTDAAKWAGAHDRAFFAAGKGRSTIDPIWRKAVKGQLAREPGVHAATLGWDLRKFYEMIVHDKLRAQAKRYGFQMQIVEMAISAYCMGRIITYDGLASGELFPTRGIVAGDSLSDILIELYYLEVFDQQAAEFGDVDLQVCFDDTQLSMEAKTNVIEARFVEAAESLHNKITYTLDAALARDKATIACTCPILCGKLRDRLGDAAGAPVQLTAFLGVDDLNGKVRAELARGSKWKERVGKHKARRGKVDRLAKGMKTGAVKIFIAGVVPEATYGVEVHGLANGELEGLRATAKLAMTPSGRARSASALFVARGDPTWRPAQAPVLRWAQEVWWTVAPRGAAAQALKPTVLRQAWEEASKAVPKSWSHARGPIDAAVLSANRVGWSFGGPFTLITDQGVKIQLFETSPRCRGKGGSEVESHRCTLGS